MKKILAMVMTCVMLAGSLALAGCGTAKTTTETSAASKEALKVGVLYISPKDDGGYSQAHAEGIAQAVASLGDKIKIKEMENVSDSDAQATTAAIDNLVAENSVAKYFVLP